MRTVGQRRERQALAPRGLGAGEGPFSGCRAWSTTATKQVVFAGGGGGGVAGFVAAAAPPSRPREPRAAAPTRPTRRGPVIAGPARVGERRPDGARERSSASTWLSGLSPACVRAPRRRRPRSPARPAARAAPRYRATGAAGAGPGAGQALNNRARRLPPLRSAASGGAASSQTCPFGHGVRCASSSTFRRTGVRQGQMIARPKNL